jgi:branched-chain amino acid transport system ATP-binding protein
VNKTEMVLEVRNLDVEVKGGLLLLRNINLHLEKGEIVSVIGNNGAGKTTLLKTISGFMKPAKGDIFLQDKKITGAAPWRIAKLGIAHVPEGRHVFAKETVRENLHLGAYSRWWKEKRKITNEAETMIGSFPILEGRAKRLAGTLSGGQQQFLAILRGLIMPPVVLLLDEPSLGLAPVTTSQVFELITECRANFGLSIVLVEQMAFKALRMADRAYVLERGAIVAEGTGKELLASSSVRKSYLGSL